MLLLLILLVAPGALEFSPVALAYPASLPRANSASPTDPRLERIGENGRSSSSGFDMPAEKVDISSGSTRGFHREQGKEKGSAVIKLMMNPHAIPALHEALEHQQTKAAKQSISRVTEGAANTGCTCISPLAFPGTLLLVALLGALFLFWRRKVAHDANKGAIQILACQRFSLQDLKNATNNFADDSLLGEGPYGSLFKGKGPNGEEWAIRQPKSLDEQDHVFMKEVQSTWMLRHSNVVRLIGYCNDQGHRMLVHEFVPNGSLRGHLEGRPSCPLSFDQRLSIAIDVAAGLEYIHHFISPPLVHREIRPEHILLDAHMKAKISDFIDLATVGDIDRMTIGTQGYMDPLYMHSSLISTAIDVYSYGITLLELMSGKRPSSILDDEDDIIPIADWVKRCMDKGDVMSAVDEALLKSNNVPSEELMAEIMEVGIACANASVETRPTMTYVSHKLNGLKFMLSQASDAVALNAQTVATVGDGISYQY